MLNVWPTIVLALEHCHSLGVIHRNVTPESVLLLGNGYIKLGNFLMARRPNEEGLVTGLSGTIGYMAPERCASDMDSSVCAHGAPADWFSLGACLYELLAGHPPQQLL